MKKSLKLNAYTLIEMIIVMIISAIIVSMAYVVFSKVNVLSIRLKNLYQENYKAVLLDKLLYADFEHAQKIVKIPNGFICEYEKEKHKYFISDIIVRVQQAQIDTFDFVKELTVDYTYTNENQLLVKRVKLQGIYEEEDLMLLYTKEYGADIFVNNDE